MSLDWLADSLLAMPDALKWALALIAAGLGLPMILWPERIVRGLRKWLLYQLRLVRRPVYRRMLKLYGWLLFGCGALLTILLLLGVGS